MSGPTELFNEPVNDSDRQLGCTSYQLKFALGEVRTRQIAIGWEYCAFDGHIETKLRRVTYTIANDPRDTSSGRYRFAIGLADNGERVAMSESSLKLNR